MGTVRRYSLGRSHALCFSSVATRWKGTSQTRNLYRHLYTRAKTVNCGDDAAKLKIQGSDTGARRRTQPQMHTLTDPALQTTTGVNVFLGQRASSIFHRLRWQRGVRWWMDDRGAVSWVSWWDASGMSGMRFSPGRAPVQAQNCPFGGSDTVVGSFEKGLSNDHEESSVSRV